MKQPPTTNFPSSSLPPEQQSILAQLEASLSQENEKAYREGVSAFLQSRLVLTEQAFFKLQPEIHQQSLQALKKKKTKEAKALARLLWDSEELSPFGSLFLAWHEKRLEETALYLSPEALRDYLARLETAPAHPKSRSKTKPKSKPKSKVETKAEPEAKPQPETKVEPEAKPEPETKVEPETKTEPEAKAEPEPKAEPEAKSKPEPKPKASKSAPQETPAEQDGEILELSSAPLSPLEAKSQLIFKKKYFGYGKNHDGVMGYCGQFTISRFDDAPLEATLESSNPLLFLSTKSIRGKSSVVTYWMPPAAFPQPSGHLTLQSPQHRKVISIGSLFPQSRTDFLSDRQVVAFLLAPAMLALLYFEFVYLTSVYGIINQVKELFPEQYAAALLEQGVIHFRAHGVGLYQLEVVPTSESLQLIWAASIWLAPLLAAKFFRHLSWERQRSFGGLLGTALMLPSLGLLLAWHVQKKVFPLLAHADFYPIDLKGFLTWGVPLNLAVAVYLFLSVHKVWDRILARELRFLLPVSLSFGYAVVVFLLIFGRSWTG